MCCLTYNLINKQIMFLGKKSHTYEDELDYGDDEKKIDQRGPRPTTKRFICDMCDETFVYMKCVFSLFFLFSIVENRNFSLLLVINGLGIEPKTRLFSLGLAK